MCVHTTISKLITLLLTGLTVLFSFTACSKDNILKTYHNAIEFVGEIAVTADSRLVGKRQTGHNNYTGTYTANYKDYSETEFPFGGTSLEVQNNGSITVDCTLNVKSGTVVIFFASLGEEIPITGEPGTYTHTFEVPAGANYIGVRGSEFTGTVTIEAR